jgi:predicted acetyltransferase
VGTAGPDGGRIYYEIVRSQRKKAGHAEEILGLGPKTTKE